MMAAYLRGYLREIRDNLTFYAARQRLEQLAMLNAKRLIADMKRCAAPQPLKDIEFKVFSQFGDDGIIQYLIHHAGIRRDEETFVEFGVEDYTESNTRFLLMNDNWRGLVLDGDPFNIRKIHRRPWFWRHDLIAVAAFIDRDNINELLGANGFRGRIGLLSIDIDGNDYWVWERIECVQPIIVVAEYNSVFGGERAVTVPYNPTFRRAAAHPSYLYWGCSIKALELLGRSKGYALVGSNSAGNNAYFVRRDRLAGLKEFSAAEAYVESRFRESRGPGGGLTFLSGNRRLWEIREMDVIDIERNRRIKIADCYSLMAPTCN
jgi:hypothetical protein